MSRSIGGILVHYPNQENLGNMNNINNYLTSQSLLSLTDYQAPQINNINLIPMTLAQGLRDANQTEFMDYDLDMQIKNLQALMPDNPALQQQYAQILSQVLATRLNGQAGTTNLSQPQNILSEAYNIYKDNGLLGLGMQYAEPSVKKAMKAADWLKPIQMSDVNKHQYVSCVGAAGGPLAAAETLIGGIYKEFDDYKRKVNNPQLLKEYGGRLGIISDNLKDFGNDVVGIWKGLLSSNSYGCEELLPDQYRNKKY